MRSVCIITGAGGRLGRALCTHLASEFEVIAIYRSRIPHVDSQIQQHLQSSEIKPVYCVQADLTSPSDVRRLVEVAMARHGRIDIVVNAAADIAFHGPLKEIWCDYGAIESQLFVNAISPFLLASAVHQALWKDDIDGNRRFNRNVVNISSVSALYVTRPQGQAYYAASKAALNVLSMYLAAELAPYSVRVNALCPGRFKSDTQTAAIVREICLMMAGDMTGAVTVVP